ncbi:MAG: hypothetical protein Q9164_004066 [Protoblastenia rupestris]
MAPKDPEEVFTHKGITATRREHREQKLRLQRASRRRNRMHKRRRLALANTENPTDQQQSKVQASYKATQAATSDPGTNPDPEESGYDSEDIAKHQQTGKWAPGRSLDHHLELRLDNDRDEDDKEAVREAEKEKGAEGKAEEAKEEVKEEDEYQKWKREKAARRKWKDE